MMAAGAATPGVLSTAAATAIGLGILCGAAGKSAQWPLFIWLPDAMEGPTPVSALIHAATMVTAGVYLIARMHPLFERAPAAQDVGAVIGAATLLIAGTIALVQVDIKRVIAYSTMSQIGYMFVGAGVGTYSNAMFHLMTHAFFKALLFLAAGIVIHALAGEQDMRRMGGLGKALPFTRAVFLIGALALVGIPFFAGFFSKDAIIAATLTKGAFGYCLFAACLAGAFLTGLYTFRMFFIVFGGERSAFAQEHLHTGKREGPFSMLWTVGVLAVLSAVGGLLQFSPLWHPLTDWLDPVAPNTALPSNTEEAIASISAVLLGIAGIWVAYAAYVTKRIKVPKPVKLFEKKFYWDELYDAIFYKPADLISRGLGRYFEGPVIGGTIGDVKIGFRLGAGELARVQNGLVRAYVLALTSGVAVLALVFISTR